MKIIKGGKTVNMVGETMNSFYGYKVIGIYQTLNNVLPTPSPWPTDWNPATSSTRT